MSFSDTGGQYNQIGIAFRRIPVKFDTLNQENESSSAEIVVRKMSMSEKCIWVLIEFHETITDKNTTKIE